MRNSLTLTLAGLPPIVKQTQAFSTAHPSGFGHGSLFSCPRTHAQLWGGGPSTPPPLCDIPSGCCSFTGLETVACFSLRMLRRVAVFCRPLRPVLLLVSFPRSRSPVFGVPGLC